MRPEPLTPKKAVSRRAEFWLTIATRSPWPDAQGVEPGGLGPGPLGHLAIGERAPGRGRLVGLVDHADAVRVDQLGPSEEVGDGQRYLHRRSCDPDPAQRRRVVVEPNTTLADAPTLAAVTRGEMDAPWEHRILERIAAGDELALSHLYDQYASFVFALAQRVTQDRSAAEDIAQEVFVHVWTKAVGLRPRAGHRTSLARGDHPSAGGRPGPSRERRPRPGGARPAPPGRPAAGRGRSGDVDGHR